MFPNYNAVINNMMFNYPISHVRKAVLGKKNSR